MNTENKTHWKLLINPDYVGAYWLPPGEDVTVFIEYVQRENVKGVGGKSEECTVAHLKDGVKPFILNATNSKSIAKLYGPYIEDWSGQPITLYASTTKMAGEVVECLRIRPTVSVRKKPPINDDRFAKALQAIKDGTYTAEKLCGNFELSLEQDGKLDAALEEMVANDIPEGPHNA